MSATPSSDQDVPARSFLNRVRGLISAHPIASVLIIFLFALDGGKIFGALAAIFIPILFLGSPVLIGLWLFGKARRSEKDDRD